MFYETIRDLSKMNKVLIILGTLLLTRKFYINYLEEVNFQGADTAVKNCDGKTPLECSSIVRDRAASHTSQPFADNPNNMSVFCNTTHATATGKQRALTDLPPFSVKLREDEKLKLSHDDFNQSIQKFYANKILSAIDQLKTTPLYPTPYVLAQFASMAYDKQNGDPEHAAGWQLLTTASNGRNGYFGTAYWHPEHQQVVISHRGNESNNVPFIEDFYTDIVGEQMSSASTFAYKVVAVLQEVEQEKKIIFELFFTGYSLGGLLAQNTAFTTEYCEVKNGTFLKKLKTQQEEHNSRRTVQDSHDVKGVCLVQETVFTFQSAKYSASTCPKKTKTEQDEQNASSIVQESHDVTHSYHPHTFVFDSPGYKTMLSQMKQTFDVHLHGSSIDLQHIDITSYLSAPNLINTHDSHLGTVYRIFTDLSDMGSKEKHTPLYNLATHSMDKIVKVFDPETGQVHINDEGEPKIQEVVNWPVSTELNYGSELEDFFKWAEQLNSYHSEVMDTSYSKVPNGYHPLRYQTKTYNKYTKHLRIFTHDERDFLEHYIWLRQVPKFFKPEDIFSVMNNSEATKEAKQKLQNFELGNESIRCPDASTLHALIPYVKRLVRLFPQIKENVKVKLSSPYIRSWGYQNETQINVETIRKEILEFNPGALNLREFLTSDKQIWHLRMTDGEAWTGLSAVYWVLHKTSFTPNYSSEDHYTIFKLKQLLNANRTVNWNALLTSMETPHLLMIVCGINQTVNDELENMFRGFFSILKQKNAIKVILTTQSDDDTADLIQKIAEGTIGDRLITTDEQLTWSDLTASSQTRILEKTVIFQGTAVALNQLTSVESMTDSFPLAELPQEEFNVGVEPAPCASSGYSEKYYINRTFNHKIIIRQNILRDKEVGKFDDLLASTEQEFKQLCQQNANSNVHWLVKNESGALIWRQSQGDLKILRKYIDGQDPHFYAPNNLDKLLQQAKQQMVMIIADKAGMGKSTVLTHLSKRIKQKYPANWLVRIDLNDYTELLKAQKVTKIDKGLVLEFVSKEVLKLESHLEKELWVQSFEGNEVNKVVIMVDGFHEVGPKYNKTVIDMLKVLKQASVEQLWVTTRPHMREELEDHLQQLSYTLQPFSEEEQIQFLKQFWTENLKLVFTNQHRLQIYAEALITKFSQSISEETVMPIQTHMLAEAFKQEFRSFYMSEKSEPELPHKVWHQAALAGSLEALQTLWIWAKQTEINTYELLLAQTADGYTAFHLAAQNNHVEILKKLWLWAEEMPHNEKDLKTKIFLAKDKYGYIAWHLAAVGGSLEALKTLRNWATEAEITIDDLFLAETADGYTAFHLAAQNSHVQALQKLWVWAEGNQHNQEEFKRKIFLAENKYGYTAWHREVLEGRLKALETLWIWSKEAGINTDKLLLASNRNGFTAFHLATENNHLEILDQLWVWAEEPQQNSNELKKNMLLATDKNGHIAWFYLAKFGGFDAMYRLQNWTQEAELSPVELLGALSPFLWDSLYAIFKFLLLIKFVSLFNRDWYFDVRNVCRFINKLIHPLRRNN